MNRWCFPAFFLLLTLFSCNGQTPYSTIPFFKGVSFVGVPYDVTPLMVDKVTQVGANSITLMPFAYGKLGSPDLRYNDIEWQWLGESLEGVEICIQKAQSANLMAVIKPQLWLDWGSFTGDHRLSSDSDWKTFEQSYKAFILPFAKLSEQYQLPLFCIGTELGSFVKDRPEFWRQLILEIRTVYSGKLTYAANWDTSFDLWIWEELDCIGMDAYFPLSSAVSPTVQELEKGWEQWLPQMELLVEKFEKPILFTEWGYRSMPYTADKPWETSKSSDIDLMAQANAYRAVQSVFSSKEWFKGGFVWKWYPSHSTVGGSTDNRFTPQNKPAEKVLEDWFRGRKN